MARRPARVLRAARAWLVATAVLAVQLFGVGHFAIWAHARCEHGELVHGTHADGADGADGASAGSRDDHGPAAQQGDAPDGHEHCDGASVTPALIGLPPAWPPLALVDGLLPETPAGYAAGVRPIALLSLAPKSSPPG